MDALAPSPRGLSSGMALALLALVGCVGSIHAQTVSCADYTYPSTIARTIWGACGVTGDGGEDPEIISGTSGNDVIDGSPPQLKDADGNSYRPADCIGVHERITGNGGNDIFMVDFNMPVTGTDTDPDENDQRSWYPDVVDFGPGDTMVVYNVPAGAELLAEIYNIEEDDDLMSKQSGQIYVMIGTTNDTKKARMRFDCGDGYTVWGWGGARGSSGSCGSASGYCTAIFCDTVKNRVFVPLICVPDATSSDEFPFGADNGFDMSQCVDPACPA